MADVHVETYGDDGLGNGSPDEPYRTIEWACLFPRVNTGDVVKVGPGSYTPASSIEFNRHQITLQTKNATTGNARGSYHSLFGASLSSDVVIQGGSANPLIAIWDDDDIIIDGFEITNAAARGINATGARSIIRNCYIHHCLYGNGLYTWFWPDGQLLNTRVNNCGTHGGDGGTTHNVYLSTAWDDGIVDGCYIHNGGENNLHVHGNKAATHAPYTPSDGKNKRNIVRQSIFRDPGSASDFMNTWTSIMENCILDNEDWRVLGDTSWAEVRSEDNTFRNNLHINGSGQQLRFYNRIPTAHPGDNNRCFNSIFLGTTGDGGLRLDGDGNDAGSNYQAIQTSALETAFFVDEAVKNFRQKRDARIWQAGAASFDGESAPTEDILGTARPGPDALYDIGPFEDDFKARIYSIICNDIQAGDKANTLGAGTTQRTIQTRRR